MAIIQFHTSPAQVTTVTPWSGKSGYICQAVCKHTIGTARTIYFAEHHSCRMFSSALIGKISQLLKEKERVQGRYTGMAYADSILKTITKGAVASIYEASPKQLGHIIAALHKHIPTGCRCGTP